MPNRLQKAIGVVKDQTSISLAKVNNSQPNLQVAILKATTHDDSPIDERYVQEILNVVSSNKIHAAECARAICRRIKRTRNWIVALKSLMLMLRIFQDGDPYFPREILHATNRDSKLLNLSNFCDHSSSNPWDYTGFVRMFGLYLEERLDCFLTGKLQRRYTYKNDGLNRSRKRANNIFCDMKPTMLLDRIVFWQRLLERAIATRPTGVVKQHQLVKMSVYMVVKESFDLYKDISNGLAILLLDNNLSKLQHESRVELFEICVKAQKQFEELDEFYAICKKINVGKLSEYPEVRIVSGELIETLQEFLKEDEAQRQESHAKQTESLRFSCSSTERVSYESSKCKSLEDTKKRSSILVDMKAYSGQSKKRFQHQEPILDLISFDDWTDNDVQKENKKQKGFNNSEHKECGQGGDPGIVIAQTPTFQQSTYRTSISNTSNTSTAITIYGQPQPQLPHITNLHNPFLKDLNGNNPFA